MASDHEVRYRPGGNHTPFTAAERAKEAEHQRQETIRFHQREERRRREREGGTTQSTSGEGSHGPPDYRSPRPEEGKVRSVKRMTVDWGERPEDHREDRHKRRRREHEGRRTALQTGYRNTRRASPPPPSPSPPPHRYLRSPSRNWGRSVEAHRGDLFIVSPEEGRRRGRREPRPVLPERSLPPRWGEVSTSEVTPREPSSEIILPEGEDSRDETPDWGPPYYPLVEPVSPASPTHVDMGVGTQTRGVDVATQTECFGVDSGVGPDRPIDTMDLGVGLDGRPTPPRKHRHRIQGGPLSVRKYETPSWI